MTDVATLRAHARQDIDAITDSYAADKTTVIKLLNAALKKARTVLPFVAARALVRPYVDKNKNKNLDVPVSRLH